MKEKEEEELERAVGGELAGDKAKLGFMYKAPESAATKKGSDLDLAKSFVEEVGDGEGKDESDGIEYEEGDDEAAKEFRRMMAGAAPSRPKHDVASATTTGEPEVEERKFADSELSALEKSVGRRHNSNAPSYPDQIRMHPELANAPLAKGIKVR